MPIKPVNHERKYENGSVVTGSEGHGPLYKGKDEKVLSRESHQKFAFNEYKSRMLSINRCVAGASCDIILMTTAYAEPSPTRGTLHAGQRTSAPSSSPRHQSSSASSTRRGRPSCARCVVGHLLKSDGCRATHTFRSGA